jgi:hypothetical protein
MSRISISEEYLKQRAIPTAQKLRDPHRAVTEVEVRKVTGTTTPQSAPVAEVNLKELNFNQNPVVDPDAYHPAVEQKGGTFLMLAVLLPKNLKSYAVNAGKEAQLTGVA